MSTKQSRITENGTMQFHDGTPEKLLQYVKDNAKQGDVEDIIKTIDEFCWNEHWMMNLGDEKGKILDREIEQHKPSYILEMGAYCGYSALRMMRYWNQEDVTKHFITLEFSEENAKIASEMISYAGRSHQVDILVGPAGDSLRVDEKIGMSKAEQMLRSKGDVKEAKFDLVFIDHAKSEYLNDLLLLEKSGLMRPGTVVVADNVIVFEIHDYLKHVRKSGLYSRSTLHEAHLEYDDGGKSGVRKKDGVEVSIWQGPKEEEEE